MDTYLNYILQDQNYSINKTAPVVIRRDNIDIKDTIALIEQKIQAEIIQPEIKIHFPKNRLFSDFEDQPV